MRSSRRIVYGLILFLLESSLPLPYLEGVLPIMISCDAPKTEIVKCYLVNMAWRLLQGRGKDVEERGGGGGPKTK